MLSMYLKLRTNREKKKYHVDDEFLGPILDHYYLLQSKICLPTSIY